MNVTSSSIPTAIRTPGSKNWEAESCPGRADQTKRRHSGGGGGGGEEGEEETVRAESIAGITPREDGAQCRGRAKRRHERFFFFLNILKFSTQGRSLHAKDAANKFIKNKREILCSGCCREKEPETLWCYKTKRM